MDDESTKRLQNTSIKHSMYSDLYFFILSKMFESNHFHISTNHFPQKKKKMIKKTYQLYQIL